MSTVDFITELFCYVDEHMPTTPKHVQAKLHPSEIVTLALLFALKGVGPRAFAPLAGAGLSSVVSQTAPSDALVPLVRDPSYLGRPLLGRAYPVGRGGLVWD